MATAFNNLYQARMDEYQVGTLPLYGYQNIIESWRNNNGSNLPVGVAVIQKTADDVEHGVALPEVGTTAEKIVGFTILNRAFPVSSNAAYEPWEAKKECSILEIGKIILLPLKGANKGENVHVYVSAGKFGQVTGAADSADGASTVELLGCKWQETVGANEPCPVVVHNLTYKAS